MGNNEYVTPDLPIGSIGPQNLGGLRPRCIIYLTLLLDFHIYVVIMYTVLQFLNNHSVIFLTQLHSISEYVRTLSTPHHFCPY